MKNTWHELAEQYTSALQDHLAGAGEAVLQRAYELGRKAIVDGLGVLEMAALHHEAMAAVLPGTFNETAQKIKAAESFFVESLSPFEITHRGFREANAALGEAEAELIRLSTAVRASIDSIVLTDLEGKITDVNEATLQMHGTNDKGDLVGKSTFDLIAPEDREKAFAGMQEALEKGHIKGQEYLVVTKNGSTTPVEMSVAIIKDVGGKPIGFVGISRDITERKLAEKALHRLNERLEEEIKRIAHALHDEAGQLLAAVHIALAEVAYELPPPVRMRLQEVQGLLDQIESQLRHLSHELRPTILDDLGLRPALEFLAQGASQRARLLINVEGSTAGRLPPLIETALYRIVQETLTNVTKHAQATRVRVELQREARMVCCSIKDDGIGFDVPGVLSRRGERGLGLIGIRERLSSLGGTLEILSAPGQGTELLITIPLET